MYKSIVLVIELQVQNLSEVSVFHMPIQKELKSNKMSLVLNQIYLKTKLIKVPNMG